MAYSKTTWSTGDTITAAKMNKIEQGVYDAHNGSGSGSGSSEQYADYDAVVSIYQPNASADPTIDIIKGNYSIITAKLNSGTTAPAILILYKDERSDRYVTRPGEIWYYSPNATPPFFNVSLYVTRTYYSLSSSSGADVRTVTIHWPNTNIITPW